MNRHHKSDFGGKRTKWLTRLLFLGFLLNLSVPFAQGQNATIGQLFDNIVSTSLDKDLSIHRIRKDIRLVVPSDFTPKERDEHLSMLLASEIRLFSGVGAFTSIAASGETGIPGASALVVVRDLDQTTLGDIARQMPGFEQVLEADRNTLSPKTCSVAYFNKTSDHRYYDNVYFFIGRDVTNLDDCLHTLFLRSLGVSPLKETYAKPPGQFFAELIAVNIFAECVAADVKDHLPCIGRLRKSLLN